MAKRCAASMQSRSFRPTRWLTPQKSSASSWKIITKKMEEDFLFPRFENANQLVDLVKVLREQHQAGRRVTDVTLRFANQGLAKKRIGACSARAVDGTIHPHVQSA
jgi:hypothetical protein